MKTKVKLGVLAFGITLALTTLPFLLLLGGGGGRGGMFGGKAVQVTAEDLCIEFGRNQIAADSKYKGRWVEVWGQLAGVQRGSEPHALMWDQYLMIGHGRSKSIQMFGTAQEMARVKGCEMVTVRGYCDGERGQYIVLTGCKFVDARPGNNFCDEGNTFVGGKP